MLTELQLKNFRCFESLSVRLNPRFNFFVGPNGEGKTSILEAACVLLRLQSQRSSSLAPLTRVGAKSFSVAGNYDGHWLRFNYGELRRRLEFDGVEQRTSTEYLRLARVVWFANTDIELIRGSGEPRRRYVDFVGSQMDPKYRTTLRAYERAVRSRNALLKNTPVRSREIAAYDLPLIEHGTRLHRMRAGLISQLGPLTSAAYAEISDSKERVDVFYAPGNEEDFAADLARTQAEQMRLRQTVVGPHRDDLDLFVDGMPAQVYASEGQQRSLALALKLAQARLFGESGSIALLLIDDIFGELDETRRTRLFGALPEAQALVTSTSPKWPDGLGEHVTFHLRDRQLSSTATGMVEPINSEPFHQRNLDR
ncbi:MAG TPA: DNA replication and repair protein RecF [Chthoniobacterales bacterium]|nr:DNA replication and repair protein RecF [Chthoniobacterales bacterium]